MRKNIPLPGFVVSIILLVLGALMVADTALVLAKQSQIFFEGINYKFEFVVGVITIIIAANMMKIKER